MMRVISLLWSRRCLVYISAFQATYIVVRQGMIYMYLLSFLLCLATSNQYYILVKELKVERVSWSIPVFNISRTSQTDLSKGELLIRKGDLMHVKGNEGATFKFNSDSAHNIAQLDDVQLGLLEAIPTPNGRMLVFVTPGWLDWGAAVKAGDSVYIRVPMKDGSECCTTARVHYIGHLTGDQPGTMFGVEITVS